MAEGKTYQIAKVATELGIGRNHLVETLHHAGYTDVADKPTTKISHELYDYLCKVFAVDKKQKLEADKVILYNTRRQEAEELSLTEFACPIKENLPKVEQANIPVIETKSEEKVKNVPELVKVKSLTLEGPKVVDKINLDADKKKKDEKLKVSVKPTSKTIEDDVNKKKLIKPTPIENIEVKQKIEGTVGNKIPELIERKKITLDGPKITGETIDLSKFDELKETQEDKRKRERKKINKSKVNIDTETKKLNQDVEKLDTLNYNQQGSKSNNFQRNNHNNRFNNNRQQNQNNRNNKGNNKSAITRHDEIISDEEIQKKIKETMAKLGASVSSNTKHKTRTRPKSHEQHEEDREDANILELTEFITVSELASLMDRQAIEIITSCFKLGVMVSINQRLDAEIIELVSSEFGFEAKFLTIEQQEDKEQDNYEGEMEDSDPRSPIVTIMGHVDHGKTSLLDYIRNANVVAGEMGGITQHIGAYEVTLKNGKEITFLDTPGHEAFTAMRARGAKLTDIAVIVIAADDAIMPQTKEAISHAQAAGVPIIFAINKIDKIGANTERIREQLASMNLLVEEWGGKIQSQDISAKKGINIDKLLEKILLEAELLELKANKNKLAVGSVIEASLDKGRGFTTNVMVQNGTLKQGDMIVAGSYFGRVKAMFNERNQRIQEAGPSSPVMILGLSGAPQAGDKFKVYQDDSEAKEVAYKRIQLQREQGIRAHRHITLEEIGRRLALGNFKELKLIIKGDTDGSVEALSDSLIKLSTDSIQISVINKALGQITETDVMLASASDAIILGFNVRPSLIARKLAEKEDIEIRTYGIIYDAIEEIKSAMEGLMEPLMEEKVVCNILVREIFKVTKVGTIAGCIVQEGKVTRNTKVRILRDGIVIHTGELASLKRFKDDVKEVGVQMECGLHIKNFNDIQIDDVIEGFEEVQIKNKAS